MESNLILSLGSAADVECDAVVNAANRYLMAGGGICGAIFKKAGVASLRAACAEYKIPLDDGDAVITPAFNIKNAKYIIHAVGPDFGRNVNAFDKLRDAYYNSLKVLMENGLHSVSFPLISSGIFGGELEDAVGTSTKQCVLGYLRFVSEYPEYQVDVKLCAFSENEFFDAKRAFEKTLKEI